MGPRLERVRPGDLLLVEGRLPVVGARSRPSDETIRPSFIGYSVGWRSETSRGSRVELGGGSKPATQSTVARAMAQRVVEVRAQLGQLDARRRAREAADADADRVDRPAAEDRDDPVAGLLERQAALDGRGGRRASSMALA